jgi:ABC-type molybdate transport system substrate-binding protein
MQQNPECKPVKENPETMADIPMPVIPDGREDDLHNLENAAEADLVLFMAGNQFMVLQPLLDAFRSRFPDIETIVSETLPPGLELRQILAGGAVFRGTVLDIRADVYTSVSIEGMDRLIRAGLAERRLVRPYLHNRLSLMVPAGNPADIGQVKDLGKGRIRVSQPDPELEDIGFHIVEMYRGAGGKGLVHRIMEQKRAEGTTIFTRVHHRETPLRITKGSVDVGPVWATEILNARSKGESIDAVEPGPDLDQRSRVTYYICPLKSSQNEKNAARFIEFIASEEAGEIYRQHGFLPHSAAE